MKAKAQTTTDRAAALGAAAAAAAAALLALVLGAAPLLGQGPQQADDRWLPWSGCWEPAEGFAGPALCVVLQGDGVEWISVAEDRVVERRSLVADGVERVVVEEGCRGTEVAAFSADGRRVFLRTQLSCDGGGDRQVSGILSMVSPGEWVDVSAVEVAGETATWVQRYRSTSFRVAEAAGLEGLDEARGLAVRTARTTASLPPTVDQVVEASAEVHPVVVEGWLAERGAPLAVDARSLIRMADAGVPEGVIDVVVAVSHPRDFTVSQVGPGGEAVMAEATDRSGDRTARTDLTHSYGYYGARAGYGVYGMRYPVGGGFYYGVLPYSYGAYGWGPGWGWGPTYGPRPTVIVVDREPAGPLGRVVRDRGYVRGGGSQGTARPSGGSDRGTSQGTPPRRDGGTTTAAPSAGTRGSDSSTSTGRTAVPRGGGG